jgi:UDP-N-acetylmuramoyl-tripeptide--D-alanyl-D-alanine ligase
MRWMASLFEPRVGVLTNVVGEDHLVHYGTAEALAREKRALLERLPPDGVAVIGADSELARSAAEGLNCRVVLAGRGDDAEVRLLDARLSWPHGVDLRLRVGAHRELAARIAVPALHFAPLVAISLAAAVSLGVDPERALAAAGGYRPRPGRLFPERGPNGSMFILDDNKSLLRNAVAAVETLGRAPARRRIAVIGKVTDCRNDADTLRPLAAALEAASVDRVLAVGEPADALRELLAPTALAGRVTALPGVDDTAETLDGRLHEGDVVLIHGSTRRHLGRVKMILDGERVGCRVQQCALQVLCRDCSHLRSGPPPALIEIR